MSAVFEAIRLEALYQISCKSRRACGLAGYTRKMYWDIARRYGAELVWNMLERASKPADAYQIQAAN